MKQDDILTPEEKIINEEIERLISKYPEFKLKSLILLKDKKLSTSYPQVSLDDRNEKL